jgi:adenine-specific DNA-methyltransferase
MYDFAWHDKDICKSAINLETNGILVPYKEESVNFDETENLYIEGDNLEVLKLLQKSYYGKIKMIYIDPPYNTGKDFIYKDNFKDNLQNYLEVTGQVDGEGKRISTNQETAGRYHSNWLNMMYPRLSIARDLLTDDGVIFISIDDNEVHNLRKICDEIFGEENALGTVIIKSTPNARDYGHIGKMHEFALFYGKNADCTTTNMLPDENKTFRYSDEISGYNVHPLYNSNVAFNNKNRPNLFYPFYLNSNNLIDNEFYEISLDKKVECIEIYPPKSVKDGVQFVWRWGKEKSSQNINKEIIGYKTNDGEFRIVQKMRHSEKIIRSILSETEYSSRRGTAETEGIIGGKIFSFPKPLSLLKDFIKVGTDIDSIILDFFSGSATTAHAVMQLNAEDGGSRKYIMVQLPETTDENTEAYKAGYKNICEIGKERIRRAGEKIKEELKTKNAQLKIGEEPKNINLDIGFKVLKIEIINIKNTYSYTIRSDNQ